MVKKRGRSGAEPPYREQEGCMFNRSEQLEILNKIKIKDNETKRINCPFCGGKYTFTLSKRDGGLVWNCYKASCSTRGGTRVDRSLSSIKDKLSKASVKEPRRQLPLPAMTSDPRKHPEVMHYLETVHVSAAFLRGDVEVRYDPKEHRVLFYMNNGTGCVGRSLYPNAKPKWKAFGDTSGIFTCGSGSTGVVVEDAASACAVSVLSDTTGVALLGTNISPLQKVQLRSFKRLIISLDKDASKKAIMLLRKLNGFVPTTIKFLQEDAKWLEPVELEGLFDESTRNCHY